MENQEKEKLGNIFFRTLQKLVLQKPKLDQRLLEYQFDVFQSVIIDLTGSDRLLFNTLFARIAYLGIQLKLPSDFLFELHLYRKEVYHRNLFSQYDEVYQLGLYLLSRLIKERYEIKIPASLSDETRVPHYVRKEPKLSGFEHEMKGMITGFNTSMNNFSFISKRYPDKELLVSTIRLDLFQSTILILKDWNERDELPASVVLREIGIDKQGNLYPKWIVLEPDYLVDVTAIAECFAPSGARPEYYLLNKFLPKESSKYLLIGHIVNYMLDELMHNAAIGFQEILNHVFLLAPLSFSTMEDKELVEVIQTVKLHYNNLLRVLNDDFPKLDLDVTKCVVEPSFYAPELGIQGRLDVLQQNSQYQSSIIELKSGSPFRENRYGLSSNHYTQTLLYDLMIRSVYKMRSKPLNYILYSKLPHQNLRFAPTIQAAQMEAISVRNEIYALERSLMLDDTQGKTFEKLRLIHFPGAYGFIRGDIEKFEKVYAELDEVERNYYHKMTGFVAKEHHLAKTGLLNHKENNGMAALWLENIEMKLGRFAVYTHLTIDINHSMKDPPVIHLNLTPNSNELANFRVGDIVVLRPMKENGEDRLSEQVIRASLIELTKESIGLKLRSRQYDQGFFEKYDSWRIEPDFLDSGFRKMYESLFRFISSKKESRAKLLGITAPSKTPVFGIETQTKLTQNQLVVLEKMIASPDYFLLWGPPGTGKTSVMLAGAVEYLLNNTKQNILLLAYTNRAVDEICEMLEQLDVEEKDYIRIGSKYATGEKYRNKLLDIQINQYNSRAKLRKKLEATRLFTGTTSSLSGKMELFQLKKFDLVFIDEASQILEPTIIGILPLFKKFVLIGDHRQLPAVVVQSENSSAFEDDALGELGINNGRVAFFDRIYNRCLDMNWDWAIGILYEQGRMHQQIMEFAGNTFYERKLLTLPGKNSLIQPLQDLYLNSDNNAPLMQSRMLFIDVEGDENYTMAKNNQEESEMVIRLILELTKRYKNSSKQLDDNSIGIITPFRAQIAQIRKDMIQHHLNPDEITIDTVERYQGGAREIIIYSTVVNSEKRLVQIQANDSKGVDRKLNVAVTRAKEQFILVGNKTILCKNRLYKRLISSCVEISM